MCLRAIRLRTSGGHRAETKIETVPQRVHVPRSNWMKRESTGAHFTLKLASSGRTSVGRARFKSLLAHVSDWPRVPDPGLRRCGTADFSRRTPRCLVVAVPAACSSSSTSGARLSHLSHVVCVGRSTRRSEV